MKVAEAADSVTSKIAGVYHKRDRTKSFNLKMASLTATLDFCFFARPRCLKLAPFLGLLATHVFFRESRVSKLKSELHGVGHAKSRVALALQSVAPVSPASATQRDCFPRSRSLSPSHIGGSLRFAES